MNFIIAGGCVILIGLILIWIYRRNKRNVAAIAFAREAKIADLTAEFEGVSEGLGKGFYKQLIALHGTIRSDKPLESEISNTPCVKYRSVVERKWEETIEGEDEQGNLVKKVQSGGDVVASNERDQPFFVDDGTGSIKVSPNGADIELEKVIDRYEPFERVGSVGSITIGSLTLNLGANLSSRRRLLGYSYQEWLLPVDRRIFICGEVTDSSGELTFEKPADPEKKEPYVISMKSKSELIGQITKKIKGLAIAFYLCLGIGGLLVVWGLLRI
ncbi:E3 ubiquitin ligase family protein [candidate division KSB1 bacterium]|nr:E3 ubiquitin ligase family protein [candidate division KSB1 bacterium]